MRTLASKVYRGADPRRNPFRGKVLPYPRAPSPRTITVPTCPGNPARRFCTLDLEVLPRDLASLVAKRAAPRYTRLEPSALAPRASTPWSVLCPSLALPPCHANGARVSDRSS